MLAACGNGNNAQTSNNSGAINSTESKDEVSTVEEEVLDVLLKDRETLENIQRVTLAKPVDEINYIDFFYALEDLKTVTDNITTLNLEEPSDTEYYLRLLKSKHEARYPLLKPQYEQDFMKSASAARDKDSNILNESVHKMGKNLVIYGIEQYVNELLNIEPPAVK